MALFTMPRSEAEGATGGEFVFAEGWYEGTVEDFRKRDIQRGDSFLGPSGPVFMLSEGAEGGEVASIQLGNNAALEGQPDPGLRKFFVENLLLADGSQAWFQPVEDENWRLQQTRRRLTNFALALGAVEDDGNGNVGPIDSFPDLLEGGGFEGQRIRYRVAHRDWTAKSGKSGTEVFIAEFAPAGA